MGAEAGGVKPGRGGRHVHDQSLTTSRRVRTLVVTGDDFGLTPGINEGIVQAHRRGILTHSSVMAAAPFAPEALQLARETPSLSLGVHLVLADGRPCLPPHRVRTLVDGDGRFRPTAGAFVRDWIASAIDAADVERELRAQIETVRRSGRKPTHLDAHKHLHMWPPIFDIVARLADESGIRAIRVAVERPILGLAIENRTDRPAFSQSIDNAMMAPLGWMAWRSLARRGIAPTWFLGRVHTGLLTPARLERAFQRIPPGRAEMMTHPGLVDEQLSFVRTRLRAEREHELALLCAPETRALLRQAGVELARAPDRQDESATPGGDAALPGRASGIHTPAREALSIDGQEREPCCGS
jgi:chitin disaccharide deacetylase